MQGAGSAEAAAAAVDGARSDAARAVASVERMLRGEPVNEAEERYRPACGCE